MTNPANPVLPSSHISAAGGGVGPGPLPEGTVTLLFTDMEGSTRLWEQHPEAMHDVVARHDHLVCDIIRTRGGYVFKTLGDAVCAAFSYTADALDAALAAQVALMAMHWGEVGPLRVRMALHTGAVQERGGDYFGPPLNRAARLLAAGHGGQVLLSTASEELVRDDLPDGVSLRDMGERRLRDLTRPERIYQVVSPLLPSNFPPLRTLDARRNNLPQQPTPLIGREREVTAIRARLMERDVHLLTLTGPGGTGKTRLSLQVAADAIDDFDDGVFFVPLAEIRDPDLVPPAIALAVEVREQSGQPLLETLQRELRDKHVLLVLDNFEQVTAAAPIVGQLIAACPRLKLLATSRIVLRVYGEREFPVPPLSLPDATRLPPVEQLTQYEAIRLFVDRARDVRPDFALTAENAPAVATICHRVDGLPLAIELAAARIKIMAPQALLTRLDRRLPLLTGGAQDRPARQQTLRNLIAWSWDLLDPVEQALFARLAVFAGGCTFESAEAVVPSARFKVQSGGDLELGALDSELDVFDGLASLVDKSLLRQEEIGEGDTRFRMLETIREFALEQLAARPEATAARRAHAEYFVALAEQAQPEIYGPRQVAWLDRLEAEHDNLRAALALLEAAGDVTGALRLGVALWGFWASRGYYIEGRQHVERLLAAGRVAADPQHERLLAPLLNGAGMLAIEQGDYATARARLEESLAAWERLGDRQRMASVLLNLGVLARRKGDYVAARAYTQQSLEVWQQLGRQQGVAHALNNLGLAALELGDLNQAQSCLTESLAIKRSSGDTRGISSTLNNLAEVSLAQGDLARAREWIRESVQLRQEAKDQRGLLYALEVGAGVAAAAGDYRRALRLGSAATAWRENIGLALPPAQGQALERWLAPARVALDEGAQAEAWAAGRAMTVEAAVAEAVGLASAVAG